MNGEDSNLLHPETIEVAPDEEWIEHYDDTYGLHYYVNTTTGECYWGDPTVNENCDEIDHNQFPDSEEYHLDSSDGNQEEGIVESADIGTDNSNHYQVSPEPDNKENFEYIEEKDNEENIGTNEVDEEINLSTLKDLHIQETDSAEKKQRKLNYAAIWSEFYADEEDETTEQYNPYAHEGDLEAGLEYPIYDEEEEEEGEEWEGEEHHHEGNYEPYDEKTAPKTVKNRSKDVLTGGTNQDYLHMARMYKLTRPYSDPAFSGMCLLCHTNFADMVFFPCEHRCLCRECVIKEHICSDSEMERTVDGYCNCSLCAAIIKRILPSEGGEEVHKYWDWVYEEPVRLPTNFLKNFRHSAAVIHAVHVRTHENIHEVDSFENASKGCNVS